jgi:hypothetical protein
MNPARFISKPLLTIATLIGGQTAPDDLTVMCDGVMVGRLMKVPKSFGRSTWDWTLTGPYIAPEMGVGSGSAETKDAAKAAMRSRWDMWLTWALAQGGDVAWHG